ncbi:MAG: helix-turn-helix domain-containing protein [Bacteroidia bacterium]|nr:helix-turn-helix domain-containing protein [Bacteroidia bacterium]
MSKTMRTKEAAAYLNVEPSTLEQWRWNGRGPVYCRVGRICVYRQADLETYLDEHAYRSTTEAQAALNQSR